VKYPFENGLADLPIQENFECLNAFVDNLVKKEKGESDKPTTLKTISRCCGRCARASI